MSGTGSAANKKKGIIQFIKFMLVSSLAGIIQITLANLLPLIFDNLTIPVPELLQGIFSPDILFDAETQSGRAQIEKYVVNGVVTWGYVLPFFLSNAIANIYGYWQNKKTTFKSDAPKINFIIYFAVLAALIIFTTWLQGIVTGALKSFDSELLSRFSRTISAAVAGTVQLIVLFPLEKFVLLKEKKTEQ